MQTKWTRSPFIALPGFFLLGLIIQKPSVEAIPHALTTTASVGTSTATLTRRNYSSDDEDSSEHKKYTCKRPSKKKSIYEEKDKDEEEKDDDSDGDTYSEKNEKKGSKEKKYQEPKSSFGFTSLNGNPFSGQGTYYDISSQGISCEKQDLPKENGDMVAAINGKQYKKSLCGKCVQATGPIGTVKVQIVDYCSSCPHGDLDFTPEAFDKIAKRKDGRVPISWSFVDCQLFPPS